MRSHTFLPSIIACLMTMIFCAQSPAAQTDSVTLIMSADTEGKVERCWSCSWERGWGGLARRATLLKQLRQENPSLLLVDAGNAFFGHESMESSGKVIVSAYNALGYDVVNLSYRDFRFGKSVTTALLKDAKFTAISANLLDSEKGTLLTRPYVVKEVGEKRIALIGITQKPAAFEILPQLREQLAGISIQPPTEALAEWLPKAKANADKVILVYYGSASGLMPIHRRFGQDLTAILVGGTAPYFLSTDMKPPLITASDHGRQLAKLQLGARDEKGKVEVSQLPVKFTLEPDPDMVKLLTAYLKPTHPKKEEITKIKPKSSPTLPPSLNLNQTYPLYTMNHNRAVRLRITDAVVRDKYGSESPAEGRNYLVLNTEWENIIPLTLVREREVPTQYLIPNLCDHLYLVINGRRLSRLNPYADDFPGHVPVSSFMLERIGSKLQGNLLFEIPDDGIETLDLRFYDYAHGHMNSPLKKRTPDTEDIEQKPIVPLQKNEFLEMGVYEIIFLTTATKFGEKKATYGMEFVFVDLRARSLFTFEADATAFDPKAEEGDLMEIGTVADWKESHKYLHLIADGEYAYKPIEQTDDEEDPRFLPDIMTGEQAVFLAPSKTVSLELRCDFPNAQAPGRKEIIHPEALTFLLEGKPLELPKRPTIATIKDDVIDVEILRQKIVGKFAGEEADEDEKFLVLEISVKSTGEKGEFFQTEQQLHCICRDGEKLDIDKVTYSGIRRPTEIVWVPKGQRRTFHVVFRLPRTESNPRLAYHGYSLAEVVDLKPLNK